MKRPIAVAVILLSSAAFAPGAQAAPVTVGSPLTQSFTPIGYGGVITVANLTLTEPGANVASPITGTIVRWRITGAVGGPFRLRVLTPVTGGKGTTATGAGTSSPQTPAGTGTETFATDLPINAGQTIGLDNTNENDEIGEASLSGASFAVWYPQPADGSMATTENIQIGRELGFNAEVQSAPAIKSLSPASGSTAGGTAVTITGTELEGATSVKFGATAATSFTVNSESQITASAPPSTTPGVVDVSVTTPAGMTPVVTADKFTYAAPAPVVQCKVPKLKGKKLKAAKLALTKANCKLGKVKGPKGKMAKVKTQKPKPGTVLAPDSKVKVTTK